jgi:hypothetical protein
MDDVHVHHGDVVVPHEEPVNDPEVLREADRVLFEFKTLVETEYPNASSLYEGAKNLWEEVKFHWTQGKKHVLKGEWSADDFDGDLMDLFHRQALVWDKLLDASTEVRVMIDELYEKVV